MTAYRTVFISYSHMQAAIVERLKQDLRQHEIQIWIDHESLAPGTRSWDDAIRKGIQASDVVLYMASPEALASNNVQGELDVANFYQKPIIPIWVAGEHWVQVVPMAMTKMQHVDMRGVQYAQALQELWHALGATETKLAPIPTFQQPTLASITMLTRLEKLGFQGCRDAKTGVAFIIPPMCQIPEGKFTMGSALDDKLGRDAEKPQYNLPVDVFKIGLYPITVTEYALYLIANPNHSTPQDWIYPKEVSWVASQWRGKTLTWDIQQQQRADHPVVCITWEDTQNYCRWLAQMTGRLWRLPTEAEWEKAARWDTTVTPPYARIYPWGDVPDVLRTNTRSAGPGGTTPIGTYAEQGDSSPYGAHDMAGNIGEWTSSIWHDRPPYDANKYENNTDFSSRRVIRGGSWVNSIIFARTAFRDHGSIDGICGFTGFRLALST